VELCARDVARLSIVRAATGASVPAGLILLAAAAACAVALAVTRRHSVALLFAVLFTAGVALQMQLGARLQSDGFYYFAYLRSLAFDHDVDFANDYRLLGLGDKTYLFGPTVTGHAHSAWTIGPAIVWAPFFAGGHLVAGALHARGSDVAVDGTSYPYRQAVCVGSLFYGLLGCWFCWRLTRRFSASVIAAAAVALTVSGSFMLWYLVKEPSMTHAASMAAVAGFTLAWASTRDRRTLAQWAALGALAGLMSLIRWQNILFAIMPGIDALIALRAARHARDSTAMRHAAAGSALFLLCAIAAFTPQMLAWRAIYGSFVARSPVGPAIRWSDPHIVDILWSARNGLLSTSPVLYAASVGLVAFAWTRPDVGVPMLAAAAVMVYFNACIQDWWGSAGFGGRRFDGLIPIFSTGLAAFIGVAAALVRRHAAAAVTAAAALLALWNLALMGAAQSGAVRIGETTPFDRAWGAQARVLHDWIGNPFSFPASAIFALRNRVSPGDYDVLGTNRFLADPLQPYGRVDIGVDDEWAVGDGWHAPEREGDITFRWASTPALLRISLDRAAPLRVEVRLHAFGYPGALPQTLTISANGHACDPIAISAEWQTAACALDRSAWRSGINQLALAFAWTRRPSDVSGGGDRRALAAAIDWIRVSVER
jgi:hypothetical protein